MLFRKGKNDALREAPLGYWEKESYMLVIPANENEDFITGIFDRIAAIEGVEIKETVDLTESDPGSVKLIYEGEEYLVGFYPNLNGFSIPEFYINKSYRFSNEEEQKIKSVHEALTVFMQFNKDPKKSFHLQLKLAVAMVPSLVGILDESAEKILPSRWVRMAADSKVLPSPEDLYTVQAVSGEKGEIWLHTHGLCRCGLTELEILQSNKENCNNHYNLISTFASYLIDKKDEFNYEKDSAYIGALVNGQPIVVTCVSWTKGLSEYKKLTLGNVDDRKDGHNSRTSLIFIYVSEEDERNRKFSKVSEFDKLWGDNPLLFISNEETARMKSLAMERFNFVKDEFNNKENKILIKIGLPVPNDTNFEHIWFELIEFKGDKFRAKLLQESYDVKNMHEGDEEWYTVRDVTDWIIYTSEFAVTPGKAYLLIK